MSPESIQLEHYFPHLTSIASGSSMSTLRLTANWILSPGNAAVASSACHMHSILNRVVSGADDAGLEKKVKVDCSVQLIE